MSRVQVGTYINLIRRQCLKAPTGSTSNAHTCVTLRSKADPVVRISRFVNSSTSVNGVDLQVVELTG